MILGKHSHAWKHHYDVHAPQAKGNKSCEYCGKRFTVTGRLNSHIKEIHTKVGKDLHERYNRIQSKSSIVMFETKRSFFDQQEHQLTVATEMELRGSIFITLGRFYSRASKICTVKFFFKWA